MLSACCRVFQCALALAPPTGSCLHREAKLLTFLLMTTGGVPLTHCELELSETQRGVRQDLGRGDRVLVSRPGRGIKVGLLKLC